MQALQTDRLKSHFNPLPARHGHCNTEKHEGGSMNRFLKKIKGKKTKGQTALEYALVTAAISLVLLFAWNVVGDRVKELITGDMLGNIENQLSKGNNAVRR